jgi:hypothetical protein
VPNAPTRTARRISTRLERGNERLRDHATFPAISARWAVAAALSYGLRMPGLRVELQTIVTSLLAASEASREVSLDQLGDALGALAVSHAEIDAMISALEAAERCVAPLRDGPLEKHLGAVLAAVRGLTSQLGRRPKLDEIASEAKLTTREVRQTLFFVRVMQR